MATKADQQKADFLDACKKFLDNPDKYVQGFLRISTEDGDGSQELFGFASGVELVGLLEYIKARTIEENK